MILSVVDDLLPYDPVKGRLMCMSVLPSSNEPVTQHPILWPSLLEKARYCGMDPRTHRDQRVSFGTVA
ncbi:hypothetical protein H0H81_012648 [Sphagnurus paluster]|uniref:Uncharacterized protein n=1 Tax=Sphagnurus paluster TaxID=117069 RepID=A0A9P7K844_9AGAR|nr:hypothetical protein H0H81_012648 [Sphagnurus paluster]